MEVHMTQTDDRIAWLLGAKTPSIVFQTRKDLRAGRSPASQSRAAKARVMRIGAVPAILARQSKAGNWKIDKGGFYGPKFFSTHWSMMLLAELGAEGKDARFRRGAEYMLNATRAMVRDRVEKRDFGWSCLFGNILRYALQARKADEPAVEMLIQFSADAVRGASCRCEWNGGKPCAWGVARTLWGVAAIPEGRRSVEVKRAIRRGIKFLLEDHSLVKADYPVASRGRINPLWFKLNFPLFYQADILFTLRVLDELDVLDHRGARPALDWLEVRRGSGGRWKGSSPFRRRTWREMGGPEETGRWVTLQALRILRHAGRKV
jgi:hypothetical protein